jgi:hypothetical protein
MTDAKLLEMLIEYYDVQAAVASSMFWAMRRFGDGDEEGSWLHLFGWCEERDERDKFWKKFQDHYFDALMVKEGVSS